MQLSDLLWDLLPLLNVIFYLQMHAKLNVYYIIYRNRIIWMHSVYIPKQFIEIDISTILIISIQKNQAQN